MRAPGEGGSGAHRRHLLWTQQEARCLPQGPASKAARGWLISLPSKGRALGAWGGVCEGGENTAALM